MRSPEDRYLLIAARPKGGALRIRYRPHWEDAVREPDLEYISALLRDFADRIKEDAAGLFSQLCSLSVGPLITYSTGESLAQAPQFARLWESFIELAEE